MGPIDVVAALVSRLDGAVRLHGAAVPCSGDVPAVRPPAFLTVERVGGGVEQMVLDRAEVAVRCWAGSEAEASALALEAVNELLLAGADGSVPGLLSVAVESCHNWPDEDGGHPRWQVLCEALTEF